MFRAQCLLFSYQISNGIRFTNHSLTCNNSHLSARGRRLQGHAMAIGNDLLLSVITAPHSAMQRPLAFYNSRHLFCHLTPRLFAARDQSLLRRMAATPAADVAFFLAASLL
jgi:hypothetical protein